MAAKGVQVKVIDPKPICKYGANCYRKNPQHLSQYRHPKRKQDDDPVNDSLSKRQKNESVSSKKTLNDYFDKKPETSQSQTDEEDQMENLDTPDTGQCDAEASTTADYTSSNTEEADSSDIPQSPSDIKENIKQKFLVEMPGDFYEFWKFCKAFCPKNPRDCLKILGFQLVGPFDILAGVYKGVTKNRRGQQPNFLRHWRYYYDPPEFQTVISGDKATEFHIGYFRDEPKELPVFVAANSAAESCIIVPKGDNLFTAVKYYVDEKLKSKGIDASMKNTLKQLQTELCSKAKEGNFSLELRTKQMKERDKKVVCKSFHGAGIVVPLDKNEVGYRPLSETSADLKKILKKIIESETEEERNKNFDPLQELITLVQFANDECDYGQGLELGIDLFSYGGKVFHSTVLHLLPLAYKLLGRSEFAQIIQAHLDGRHHGADLNELA